MTDQPAPLRPRAERCPEPECTDEQQCWRCDYEEAQHAAAVAAADEASLIPPAERRAHYLGEISVTVENRLRAMGHVAAADAIVGIMCDLARQEASR